MRGKFVIRAFFFLLAITGLCMSVYSLINETWSLQNDRTWKDMVYIALFSYWAYTNYRSMSTAKTSKPLDKEIKQ